MPATCGPAESNCDLSREITIPDPVQEEAEHQNPSTDTLLQLTQAASGSIIQIPADVLTSLLQSLHGLQSSIAELKNENQGLQQALSSVETNVQKLQVHSGMQFALFPKLPLEIQRTIWGHTANDPKIIAVKRFDLGNGRTLSDNYLAPVLPPYPQLRVCKEARREFLKTALPLI
jgi:cell division protein FtsB